ncbi:MAG: hypothetical protein E7185_09860 [Erysipelotrichaceae bacterium]|nr:hypothetical protein [Erysipelotrichaceae bacterium]
MSKGLPKDFDTYLRRDKMAWILMNYGSDTDEDERGRAVLDKNRKIPEDVVKAFEELRKAEDEAWKDNIILD